MGDESATINLRIDRKTKIKFKACASLNDESMTDVLIKMIEDYIEKTENKTE